ncbi:MAG: hypothetical protein P8012_17695 [Desulfobacterales bacterium]
MNTTNFKIPYSRDQCGIKGDFLKQRTCRLAICDISPIGISVAAGAGIPSVLIENFTWDWIYEDFIPANVRMRRFVEFFQEIYRTADYHIQTAPVCNPNSAYRTIAPVSRKVRLSSVRVKEILGVSREKKFVLLTTGGVRGKYRFLKNLSGIHEICFVIPGASDSFEQHGNLILLPYRSGFIHSDLVNASDAVVGKAGYSTIAEIYQAGVPFGYVPRSNFRETGKLVSFIEKEMKGFPISNEDFQAGKWVPKISELLSFPRIQRHNCNGSHQVANMIRDILI